MGKMYGQNHFTMQHTMTVFTSSGLQKDKVTEPGDCVIHSFDLYIWIYREWFLEIFLGDDTCLLYGGNGESKPSSLVLITNSCMALT